MPRHAQQEDTIRTIRIGGFCIYREEYIVILTRDTDRAESHRFVELFRELDSHEQHMFEELLKDAEKVLKLRKPLFGLINRNGKFRVIIIPAGTTFPEALKTRTRFESNLKLDPRSGVTEKVVKKLLRVLAAKLSDEYGIRVESCHHCNETAFFGIRKLCIEYVIETQSK